MNKTVVYVGLGLLALYLLTRKKDILKSAEVKQTLPPPVMGQPVEMPTKPKPEEATQMPRVTDFSLSDVSDYFKQDLKQVNRSIPCANNPDKFYNPNMTYIMDPCRDYDKPSGEDIWKGDDKSLGAGLSIYDFIIYN
jgi:hypothetical protein